MCPEKSGHEILLERGSKHDTTTIHCTQPRSYPVSGWLNIQIKGYIYPPENVIEKAGE